MMTTVQRILNMIQSWVGNLSDVLVLFCLALAVVLLLWSAWHLYSRGRAGVRGSALGVPLIIVAAVTAVFVTGFKAQHAMIGDEVTHFYMLTTQAEDLSKPNFYAHIPMADGTMEERRYPHSFLWHYVGAAFYRAGGDHFLAVQIYHSLFFAQLLIVAYLLARSRGGIKTRAALLYTLLIASLPVVLLLSITFYQDVPMTAQALTAFYLLDRRKPLSASVFMALAIGMKVTAILFFPAFFIILGWRLLRESNIGRAVVTFSISLLIVLGFTWGIGKAINVYGHTTFYPQEKIESAVFALAKRYRAQFPWLENVRPASEKEKIRMGKIRRKEPDDEPKTPRAVIANHPGDLRVKQNFIIYGGAVLWLVCGGAVLTLILKRRRGEDGEELQSHPSAWLWLTGISYTLLTAWLIRSTPDARFFIPGLVVLLLPLAERFVKLPRLTPALILLASLALVQSGYVIAKTYSLRAVSDATLDAISYLSENSPVPDKIFMYPEGSYRLFPVKHDWYLNYKLKRFWRSSNDNRIALLHKHRIGAIVIKKHLIAPVDDEIINLGVYPVDFVRDIKKDSRFKKVYENSNYLIFATPPMTTVVDEKNIHDSTAEE